MVRLHMTSCSTENHKKQDLPADGRVQPSEGGVSRGTPGSGGSLSPTGSGSWRSTETGSTDSQIQNTVEQNNTISC